MNKNEKRRLRLFDLYSKNLSHFFPSLPNPSFMCPICRTGFLQEAVIDQSPAKDGSRLLVNIAHCYPESCGGKIVTLACKSCNNRMGTQYEHHLGIEKKLNQAFDHETSDTIAVKASFEAGNIAATFSKIGDVHYVTLDKDSNPYGHSKIAEELKVSAASNRIKFGLTFDRPDEERATVALLHTAFLMMFREFGYEYALSPMAEKIRKVLLAEEGPKNLDLPVLMIPKRSGDPRLLNTVGIIDAPPECRCFYAMMPSADPKMIGRAVVMPGSGEEGEAAISALRDYGGQNFQLSFQFRADDRASRLRSFVHRTFLRYWWDDYPPDFAVVAELVFAINAEKHGDLSMFVKASTLSEKLGLEVETIIKFATLAIHEGWLEANGEPTPSAAFALTPEGSEFVQHIPFWANG